MVAAWTLDETQQYYDRLSRWYDFLSGPSERRYTEMGLDLLDLQPGETALEIGFGTGHSLLSMSRAVQPGGSVFGLDLSPGMIAVARRRLHLESSAGLVHLTRGDAVRMPFGASRIDAVFLSFTLELFDDRHIPLVLAECKRALKPGGRLGVVSLTRPDQPAWGVRVYEWFQRAFPRALDCRPIQTRHCVEQAGFEVSQRKEPILLGVLPLEVILGRKDS